MHTKKVRLIFAAMAGGLVLTGVTAAAIASTSHGPTRVTLAADTTSSAVNLGNCPTLAEGYHGGCVNQLQTELNADDGANLPVTDTFGPATKAAVIIFQQEHHIVPAEGIVGPQTKAALDNPGSSAAAPPPGQLNPGQRITSGTQIASPDGRFVLQMQSDGNLVIRAPGNIPLRDTHTAGHDGTIAVMQTDGNFVLRAPGNIPVWSSGTDGHPGTVLQVQDDGGVVLYGPGHQVLRVLFPAALSGSTVPTTPGSEPLPVSQVPASAPSTPATQAPGNSVATPAPGNSVATPAPGNSVATPAPGNSVATPAPGNSDGSGISGILNNAGVDPYEGSAIVGCTLLGAGAGALSGPLAVPVGIGTSIACGLGALDPPAN